MCLNLQIPIISAFSRYGIIRREKLCTISEMVAHAGWLVCARVQDNWALPYYLVKKGAKIVLLTNVFSYLMGGYYYHVKAPKRLAPLFVNTGIAQYLDRVAGRILPIDRLSRKFDLIHLNDPKNPLTWKVPEFNIPKLFVLHGSLDVMSPEIASVARRELEEINSKVNAFVTASNHAASTVEKWCGFKPIVIHHGVDTLIFNPFNISKREAREKLSIARDKK